MKHLFSRSLFPLLALCSLSLVGCSTVDIFTLSPDYLQQRQIESRVFTTDNEELILLSSVEVLQDIGYIFTESSHELGILTATCNRKADNAEAKEALATIVTVLGVLCGSNQQLPYEHEQCILVSVVTRKVKNGTLVRTTFARKVFRTDGTFYIQRIVDPEIYEGFYKRLSQSIFLTENAI